MTTTTTTKTPILTPVGIDHLTTVPEGHTMITTARTTRTAQIAAPIDLGERAISHTLDDLIADDTMLVDVWDTEDHDGLTVVVAIGQDAVVDMAGNVPAIMEAIERGIRKGIGREGDLPGNVEVVRHDGVRPDLADAVVGVFVEAKRECVASWRLIGDVVPTV